MILDAQSGVDFHLTMEAQNKGAWRAAFDSFTHPSGGGRSGGRVAPDVRFFHTP